MPPPQEVPENARWYIDGSLLDGPRELISRCGSAVVVVSDSGALLAYGLGVPPNWVRSASMAELWAFYMVLQVTPALPYVVTDCLNIPQTLARGLDAACGPSRPQARLWRLVGHNLDFQCPPELAEQRFLWMPSHTAQATLGTTRRSDGQLVTRRDWRSNRLADGLAKLAAQTQRVPQDTRDYLQTAREALEYCAGRLGAATQAANSFTQTAWRDDGTAYQQRLRDALPPKTKRAAPQAAATTTQSGTGQLTRPPKQLAEQTPGRPPDLAPAAAQPEEDHSAANKRRAATPEPARQARPARWRRKRASSRAGMPIWPAGSGATRTPPPAPRQGSALGPCGSASALALRCVLRLSFLYAR